MVNSNTNTFKSPTQHSEEMYINNNQPKKHNDDIQKSEVKNFTTYTPDNISTSSTISNGYISCDEENSVSEK